MPDEIRRHLTAIPRTDLSLPMQELRARRLLRGTVLDYGCGRGDDVRLLRELGVDAIGWDPHFAPTVERRSSDVVNLGYVLNVIEDEDERVRTLRTAWSLARVVMSVAVMTDGDGYAGAPLGDGIVTRRNTFQRFFEPRRLRQFIFRTLLKMPVVVRPGIVFVFRSESMRAIYEAQRP